MAYKLIFSERFNEQYVLLLKKNISLEKRINKTLRLLTENPAHPSLKSHKVNTKRLGLRWSSIATGDIRIIWDYLEDQTFVILLLDLGGHSGKQKIYK